MSDFPLLSFILSVSCRFENFCLSALRPNPDVDLSTRLHPRAHQCVIDKLIISTDSLSRTQSLLTSLLRCYAVHFRTQNIYSFFHTSPVVSLGCIILSKFVYLCKEIFCPPDRCFFFRVTNPPILPVSFDVSDFQPSVITLSRSLYFLSHLIFQLFIRIKICGSIVFDFSWHTTSFLLSKSVAF